MVEKKVETNMGRDIGGVAYLTEVLYGKWLIHRGKR